MRYLFDLHGGRRASARAAAGLALLLALAACRPDDTPATPAGMASAPGTPAAPTGAAALAWSGFARDAQHTAKAPDASGGGVGAQALGHIAWQSTLDAAPPSNGGVIHYGSPLISANNTILLPVKTTEAGGFRVEARAAAQGALLWSASSDYLLPPHHWIPPFGPVLTPANRLYMPGSGGKLLWRDNVDSTSGVAPPQPLVFYGAAAYDAAAAVFDATVFINTPITSDANGNLFFGFLVTGANPSGLSSGFARVAADGTATWVTAAAAAGQGGQVDPAMNAAPALSADGSTLYVAVNASSVDGGGIGYLMALDASTLAARNKVLLSDPVSGQPAILSADSTASPLVGPDGDVYFGVLETVTGAHNNRGWLLHFDATLKTLKTPGSFGWDDTPSIVPASMLAGYTGGSSYLLLSKYNNYAAFGDGLNRMAILDPNQTEADPISGNRVMKEVLTVLGPTPDTAGNDGKAGAVKEWCINTAAVDPVTRSVFVNSEDGFLYRWDLSTGQLAQKILLDNGFGQAYTPTLLGPDGTVYAVNNGTVFAVHN